MDIALNLVENLDEAYRMGPPSVRRQLNQAFFEKIWVGPDETMLTAS